MGLRIIIDESGNAAWNMAADRYLLDSVQPNAAILRVYSWSAPAISIG